jgi:CRISPR-associated protein Cmr2
MTNDPFVAAIAACLCSDTPSKMDEAKEIVEEVLHKSPAQPSLADLQKLHQQIKAGFPEDGQDCIALVYGGATKIKGYVFEAPKLPEIRGASALLDWINEQTLVDLWVEILAPVLRDKQLARDCIIYASGGNILGFAPKNLGQTLADKIEQCYSYHTLMANSAAVSETFSLLELRYGRSPLTYWIDEVRRDWEDDRIQGMLAEYYFEGDTTTLEERFYQRKTFGELVTVLATAFNRRRDERSMPERQERVLPNYALLSWATKCDSSDVRAAVASVRIAGEDRNMSEASARKRYVGQVVKKDDPRATDWFTDTFSDTVWQKPKEIESWERRWLTYLNNHSETYYARKRNGHERSPQDVGAIGAASNRYIGMIYADGNNVGRLVATLRTPAEYADVSQKLSSAAEDAVFHALAHHLVPHNDVHPFEILTIGGDDLLLIVPGNKALEIALMIGQKFEEILDKELSTCDVEPCPRQPDRYTASQPQGQPRIGLSSGVVIAQENAPIFFLQRLVENLLKSAKSLARKRAEKTYDNKQEKPWDLGGAVDFMVLKSITMVTDSVAAFRREALGVLSKEELQQAQHVCQLTARPYTWHEFEGLLTTVRELKRTGMPRSQLYRIRNVLNEARSAGILNSVMEYLHTRTRLKGNLGDVLSKYVEQQSWQMNPQQIDRGSRLTLPPWLPLHSQADKWETIWPDVVEIYEMVSDEEQPTHA